MSCRNAPLSQRAWPHHRVLPSCPASDLRGLLPRLAALGLQVLLTDPQQWPSLSTTSPQSPLQPRRNIAAALPGPTRSPQGCRPLLNGPLWPVLVDTSMAHGQPPSARTRSSVRPLPHGGPTHCLHPHAPPAPAITSMGLDRRGPPSGHSSPASPPRPLPARYG